MDAETATPDLSRQDSNARRTGRGSLRWRAMLAAASLHVVLLFGLVELLHVRRLPAPAPEFSIPVIFTRTGPAPPNPSTQLLASATLPVPVIAEPIALPSLATLIVPPAPAVLPPRRSPPVPHGQRSRAATKPLPPQAAEAPSSSAAGPTPERLMAGPQASATVPADLLHALAGWEAQIHHAVQDAAIYPASARLLHREGSAQVRFDYNLGSVGNAVIAQTSHFSSLDTAALSAVTRAKIPDPPAELGPQKRTMLVWVQFRLVSED